MSVVRLIGRWMKYLHHSKLCGSQQSRNNGKGKDISVSLREKLQKNFRFPLFYDEKFYQDFYVEADTAAAK